MKILYPLVFAICLFISNGANGQVIGSNSLQIIGPSSSLSDAYDVGVSFNGSVEFPITEKLSLGLNTGYQSWFPVDLPNGDSPDEVNTFLIGAGARYFLGKLYIGSDLGYFLGEFSEFTVLPNVGLRLGKFDIRATASTLDPVNYIGFELGYFWASYD